MNNLWDKLGYMVWKYDTHLWALCNLAGGEYIWVYYNKAGLNEKLLHTRLYQNPNVGSGYNVAQVFGPCGVIRL